MSGAAVLLTLAAYAGLLCIGAIVETLGVPRGLVAFLVAVPAVLGTFVLAWANASMNVADYLAGRRPMTAFAGGAWLAMHALGGGALAALAGGAGTPILAVPLAALAAAVVASTLLGPAIHASGAATMAGFLVRCYGSGTVRLVGAAFVVAICVPLAAVLMQAGAAGAASLLGIAAGPWSFTLVFVAVSLIAVPGGMRGLAAGQKVQFLLLILACVAPATWLLASREIALPWPPGEGVPQGWQRLVPADAQGMVHLLCVVLAVAALPNLLAGFAAMRDLQPPRRVAGWGVVLVLLLLASAVALGVPPDAIADLVRGEIGAPGFDQLPHAMLVLAATAMLIAVVLVAAVLLLAAANALGHDLYHRMLDPLAPTSRRLVLSRILLILLAAAAAHAAATWPEAIAAASVWSLSLAAAGLFPALALGIWWRRATAAGAVAGMLVAAIVTAAGLIASRYGFDLTAGTGDEWTPWLGFDGVAGAAFGLPAAVATMVAVSVLGRRTAAETRTDE